nr:1,4-dihydroxy-2-naphthoyl-CoA thioesterase 1-like [Ipomoea batatas]
MDPPSSSSKSKTETLDRTLHAVGFEIGELTPSKVTEIKDRDIGSDTPRRGVRDRRADDEQGDRNQRQRHWIRHSTPWGSRSAS